MTDRTTPIEELLEEIKRLHKAVKRNLSVLPNRRGIYWLTRTQIVQLRTCIAEAHDIMISGENHE